MSLARSPHGFTVVEVMISVVLLTVVLGSVFALIVRSQRDYVRQRETVRAQEGLRMAEGALATVLRSAGADPYGKGGSLLHPDPLNHGTFDNVRVVSDFNPADGDVADLYEDVLVWLKADTLMARWQAGGTSRPMVYPVTSLRFWYYAADGSEITTTEGVSAARRVRFRIETPKDPRTGHVERRERWVFLRNRG